MEIKFNIEKSQRKALVQKFAEITGEQVAYLGTPTFIYKVGEYSIDRNSVLTAETVDEKILAELTDSGFPYEVSTEPDKLTVQMPLNLLSEKILNRVKRIIENKGKLFKAAFKTVPKGKKPLNQRNMEEQKMNEKEAIMEIREKIIPMYNNPALELAIAALEKQIPKRITRYKWSISKCPCCSAELGEWLEDGYHKDYDHLEVCNCGQHLDWCYPEKCENCEKELEDNETVWITRHYPVCQKCYNEMCPEEIDDIIENYG